VADFLLVLLSKAVGMLLLMAPQIVAFIAVAALIALILWRFMKKG
jgi:hypothetical protein